MGMSDSDGAGEGLSEGMLDKDGNWDGNSDGKSVVVSKEVGNNVGKEAGLLVVCSWSRLLVLLSSVSSANKVRKCATWRELFEPPFSLDNNSFSP